MELGEWFLSGLKEYDESLSAVYDDIQDEIHLYYSKSGQKSLAYSVAREECETYPELQRRIIRELPLKDIWRRFGSGKAYDDFLEDDEKKRREVAQKQIDSERLAKMKEDKWLIRSAIKNAQSGRFSEKDVLKVERSQIVVP